VKIGALEVLQELELVHHGRIEIRWHFEAGHGRQASEPGSPVTPLASDDAVPRRIFRAIHHNRLQEAAFAYRLRQVLKLCVVEGLPRLTRVGVDVVEAIW